MRLFNRFLDLYRELERQHIRDSVVRLMLINEQDAAQYFSGNKFGKIQLFQDNPQDNLVQRLHHQHRETLNNYVFGRLIEAFILSFFKYFPINLLFL